MKSVRTAASNLVYVGPPGVGDLHCERIQQGLIASVWQLSADERRAIAAGANVKLWVYQEPIPAVSLEVVDERGVGEDAPDVAERLAEWAAAKR